MDLASQAGTQGTFQDRQKDDHAGFAQKLAAATGTSLSSAKRQQRIASRLTKSQLLCCEQLELNQNQMETLAAIESSAQRDEILELVVYETVIDFDAACKQVVPDGKKATGQSRKQTAAAATAVGEKAPDMTDEEWFEQTCGESAKMFSNPAKFKADAILYRHTADARAAFRASTKKLLKLAKDGGVYGGLYNLINRATSLAHPKDWLICSECKGRGEFASADPSRPEPTKCRKCFGACYNLKTEDYL